MSQRLPENIAADLREHALGCVMAALTHLRLLIDDHEQAAEQSMHVAHFIFGFSVAAMQYVKGITNREAVRQVAEILVEHAIAHEAAMLEIVANYRKAAGLA